MTLSEPKHKPALYGLVLAGGKSTRMGEDKGAIKWHEKEQRYHIADLLGTLCGTAFISCRPEQEQELHTAYPTLTDAYSGIGPYGAILSAFAKYPDNAWLVAACDLPLLDRDTLQHLLDHRDSDCVATTFESPFDGLPEPLATIWEPRSFPTLLSFLSEGYTCPRKVLIRNEASVRIIRPPSADALLNANTPADALKAREIIETQRNSTHAK